VETVGRNNREIEVLMGEIRQSLATLLEEKTDDHPPGR
jgi:hypothetical protein